MPRNQQMVIVGGIAALGVLGALPFIRQTGPVPTTPVAQDAQLTLARELPPRLELSPAQGLHDDEASGDARAGFNAASISRSRLESHGLPPDLPDRYQPLASPLNERATQPPQAPQSAASFARAVEEPREISLDEPRLRIRAEPVATPVENTTAKPERTHRIVDGDTLPKLAKRYWNDESLAGELFTANQAVLDAPDPLPLGVVMRIPARPATANLPAETDIENAEVLPVPVRQPKLAAPDELPLTPIPRGAFSPAGNRD